MTASILLISYSDIATDSRVARQLTAVSKLAAVTTVAYGAHPPAATDHVEIPRGKASLPLTARGALALATRRYRQAEAEMPAAQSVLPALRQRRFDLVIANDARALPLAFACAHGAPVWADLHEWAPEERTHVRAWRWFIAPLMTDICHRYLPRCAATTTVGGAIAELYQEHFGVTPRVVRNAPAYADLQPTPTGETIRLVHSGVAVPGRSLEDTIDAVQQAGERFTLDLYLLPPRYGNYLEELRARAAACPRIRFREPVAPAQLPATLNAYDVGVFWLPPFNTNARLALPNKFFDFIQARLAVAVSPSVEMSRLVHQYDLGVVSEGATAQQAAASLATLTPEAVRRYKEAAHRAAAELNFEQESQTITELVSSLL